MGLKVGIVGCGDIFPDHMQGWNVLRDCQVQAIFDTDPEALRSAGRRFGEQLACTSLDELIDRCDVVDICTPPESHAAIALAALEKGRHLLIEKPVVLSVPEWERVVGRARDVGAKICGGFSQKFFPQVQLAKKWISEGRIGPVIRVRTEHFYTPETDWMLGDSHHWAHTLPGKRWLETLPHDVYLIRFFAGPVEVSNVSALYGTGAAPTGHADEAVVTLKGSACLAEAHYSANCDRKQRNIVITGARGTIEITGMGLVTTLTTLYPSAWKYEVGMPFLEAGEKLLQLIPNRVRWWANRLKREPPHSRLIAACARYFEAAGPAPTELEEMAEVVRCCEEAGRRFEMELMATTMAVSAAPAAPEVPGGRSPFGDPPSGP